MKKMIFNLVLLTMLFGLFGCNNTVSHISNSDSNTTSNNDTSFNTTNIEQTSSTIDTNSNTLNSNHTSKVTSKDETKTKLPSEVLDLTNWKLNLPIANEKGTSLEIKRPQLDSYYHEEYFKVNEKGDGVIFTAPVEGTTTSGSKYPRSELREMMNEGKDKANWETSNGTHIMRITQSITHLPDVKKHAIVGQIHDDISDAAAFRIENKKLFLDFDGVDGPVLNDNYILGTKFTVQFVAGGNSIMCYYNGKYIYTHNIKATGCYFKAGIYTQSNLDKGDVVGAYGECEIYDLIISHSDKNIGNPSEYEW